MRSKERLTRDQAIDEIIANSAERFLIDEAEIAKVVRQDRTLGQTILDAIRNMIKSIKRLMQGRLKELDVLKKAEKQRLPDKIENPALIIVSRKGDSIIVFTGEKDPNGLPIMVNISYSSKNKFNGVEIVTNFMTSAYGKGGNGFRSWVRNAIKDDEVLHFNLNNSQPLKNLLGANYPVLVNYGGFNENIAKFNNNVKNKFPSNGDVAGVEQIVKEHTLDRLDQTLPDTSIAEAYKKGVEKAIVKEQYKKYSLKDLPDEQVLFDYERLTEKPDMKVITIKEHDLSSYQGIKPREAAKKLRDFL